MTHQYQQCRWCHADYYTPLGRTVQDSPEDTDARRCWRCGEPEVIQRFEIGPEWEVGDAWPMLHRPMPGYRNSMAIADMVLALQYEALCQRVATASGIPYRYFGSEGPSMGKTPMTLQAKTWGMLRRRT